MAAKRVLPPALVALLCAVSNGAMAQSRADGLWRGSGGASLSASSGNTTASSLLLNADAARETGRDKISLGGMINYAKGRIAGVDQTTANKWAGHGEYDYNLSPQTFVFGKLGLEADKVIDLSLRSSLAGGMGYKIVNTEQMTFELFGGLGYTTDK